jgi:arylsulfatase
MNQILLKFAVFICAATLCVPGLAQAADNKPNIVIIWGDDIGQSNISAVLIASL